MKDRISLRQLSPDDGLEYYDMLLHIGRQENDFTNPVHDMDYDDQKSWLCTQDKWSRGEDLPSGYVPQICYWLLVNDIPVGFGKIRLKLTERSRLEGGNLGYAIDERYRGKGYGTKLLELLINKAQENCLSNPLVTIKKYNYASKCVAERNGGQLINETTDWWYYEISNK